MKNVKLKAAIFEKCVKQKELAHRTGIPRAYLSMAIGGRYNLTEAEKSKLATELGKSVQDLF